MSSLVNFNSEAMLDLMAAGIAPEKIGEMGEALEWENMRSLPRGAPLGVRYEGDNSYSLVAAFQGIAHALGGKSELLIAPLAWQVTLYCETQKRRLPGHKAVIDVDFSSIAPHLEVSSQGLKRVDEILLHCFKDRFLCTQATEYKERQEEEISIEESLQIDALDVRDQRIPEIISVRNEGNLARIDEHFTYQDAQYTLRGALVHVDEVSNYYIAYLSKGGKYYECSGSIVKELTFKQYMEGMGRSTTFRLYAKVDAFVSEGASEGAQENPPPSFVKRKKPLQAAVSFARDGNRETVRTIHIFEMIMSKIDELQLFGSDREVINEVIFNVCKPYSQQITGNSMFQIRELVYDRLRSSSSLKAAAIPAAGGGVSSRPLQAPASSPSEFVSAAVEPKEGFFANLGVLLKEYISSEEIGANEAWNLCLSVLSEKEKELVKRFEKREELSEAQRRYLYNDLLDFRDGFSKLSNGTVDPAQICPKIVEMIEITGIIYR